MSTTLKRATKDVLLHALNYYNEQEVVGNHGRVLFNGLVIEAAEEWVEEQETDWEEKKRLEIETGEKMKSMIVAALSSYEYKALDKQLAMSNADYEILHEAQKWIESRKPGEDIPSAHFAY